MRTFAIFDGESQGGNNIQAEQISTEPGGVVGFYDASVTGNSRKLLAVVILKPGQSVREIHAS